MKHIKRSIGLVLVMVLSSCSENTSNQEIGALAGTVVGGIVGAQVGDGDGQIIAAYTGAVVGSIIGSNIGATMDEVNRMKMAEVLENTKTDHSRSWVDPDTNARYTVKPTKTIKQNTRICRNFTMSIVIDGELKTAHGVACRDVNGNWKVVD